jgi:hypothetical protein
MSYKVAVLSKKVDSHNEEKVFVSMEINDDLGRYNYGVWMHPEDYDALKAEMSAKDWASWTRYSEFRFLNPNSKALTAFCEEIMPSARVNQENAIIELKIQQAERLKAAQLGT